MPRGVPNPKPAEKSITNDVSKIDQSTNLKAAIEIFDNDFKTLTLPGKIARISGYLGTIPKRGYNSFHKYNYVMEADLVAAVRQYMAAAAIIMIPDTTRADKDGDLTTVYVKYTVTDGRESFSFTIPGTGADRGDKGMYKALTGSMKYAIMKLFKIETGDDPEQDTRVDERAAAGNGGEQVKPTVTRGDRTGIGRGGHTETASPIQLRRINELVKLLDLDRVLFADMISEVAKIPEIQLPDNEDEQGVVILSTLRSLSSESAGLIIKALTTLVDTRAVLADDGGYA